jgi:hypothetical protein
MSQNFDRDRVICISLKSHNEQQLFSIAEKYAISFEVLVEMKADGFTKIWVESGGNFVIACIHKDYPDWFIVKDNYDPMSEQDSDFLKKIKQVKVPKLPKTEVAKNNYKVFLNEGYNIKIESMERPRRRKKKLPEVLDLDAILDKIGQSGMESLTPNENEFLNNYSKNL